MLKLVNVMEKGQSNKIQNSEKIQFINANYKWKVMYSDEGGKCRCGLVIRAAQAVVRQFYILENNQV